MRRVFLWAAALCLTICASAQVSPDINYTTKKVTLRLKAPNASKVKVTGGYSGDMTKNSEGVWERTFDLGSDFKCYQFDVDGAIITDPHNINLTHDGSRFFSYVASRPEFGTTDIPHGTVSTVWVPGTAFGYSQRRMMVYTPPGYETSTRRYPVLYVLHGWFNDEESWFDYGRAPYILDYLISTGEAEPMIVVSPNLMPGDEAAPGRGSVIVDQDAQSRRNGRGGTFEDHLTNDIIPFVEQAYRVYTDKYHRGICGLSHGGGITMQMVCNKPEWFGEVGLFSAANLQKFYESDKWKPNIMQSYEQPPRNFYFACGSGDSGQYPHMQNLEKKFTEWGLHHETYWSGGGHNWGNWRDYLLRFVPKLFKDGSAPTDIEAEDCAVEGEASVNKDLQASGGATVGGLGNGNWILATHETPIAGIYELSIDFVCDADRQLTVIVNDGEPVTVDCPKTGDGLKVRNGFGTATLNVTLKAGANTLRVGHATATAPVVDVLTLKLIGESGITALAPASDDTAYYSLSGVKATNPEPSEVYIHGGRKVLVKK